MSSTQAPPENPSENPPSVDEKLTVPKKGPIRLEQNPGDIRVAGPTLKRFVEADSPTKKYRAGLELQEELIKNMALEKKTWLGKIFKNKLTKAALLIGAGALLPTVGSIALGGEVPAWMTGIWERAKDTGGTLAGVVPTEYAKAIWGEMPLGSKAAFTLAGGGLAAAGIYKVGLRLTQGNKDARDERKRLLSNLEDEKRKIDIGQVHIRKAEDR